MLFLCFLFQGHVFGRVSLRRPCWDEQCPETRRYDSRGVGRVLKIWQASWIQKGKHLADFEKRCFCPMGEVVPRCESHRVIDT